MAKQTNFPHAFVVRIDEKTKRMISTVTTVNWSDVARTALDKKIREVELVSLRPKHQASGR